jgi:hypothetical protein
MQPMSMAPFGARPATAGSEQRRARLAVLIATLGIAATLLAYAVSPGVRHAVSHAAHSVKHAVSNVLDRDTAKHARKTNSQAGSTKTRARSTKTRAGSTNTQAGSTQPGPGAQRTNVTHSSSQAR